MVTRRVNGPFTLTCRNCGATYGPFTRASGAFKCGRCGKIMRIG